MTKTTPRCVQRCVTKNIPEITVVCSGNGEPPEFLSSRTHIGVVVRLAYATHLGGPISHRHLSIGLQRIAQPILESRSDHSAAWRRIRRTTTQRSAPELRWHASGSASRCMSTLQPDVGPGRIAAPTMVA